MKRMWSVFFSLALLLAALPAAAQVNVAGQSVTTTSSPTFVNQTLTGKITLPATTSSSVGAIYFGSDVWAHNFVGQGSTPTNVFVGPGAGNFTMASSTGTQTLFNTGVGWHVLAALTIGQGNTSTGYRANTAVQDGDENTANGKGTLVSNVSGVRNSAFGSDACHDVVGTHDAADGSDNLCAGSGAGFGITTGRRNTVSGSTAGYNNGGTNALTTGDDNSFYGFAAGLDSTTQRNNCIVIGSGATCDASNSATIGTSSQTKSRLYGAPDAALTQGAFSNPTGTTSDTQVMCGINVSITPKLTGRVLLQIRGAMEDSAAAANQGAVQAYYGTGTAPTNGAAVTGTAAGGAATADNSAAGERVGFVIGNLITGLSLGTTYWLDCAQQETGGGTLSITGGYLMAIEM